ncbi:NUDIX domain-containing protein [Haloarculaceae archaeon H-GB2-1]|nr:NUDIX domain-containing protein [Haloarculaceae archaeon H-GB1-1]MEA5387065.1 NUDIX domain-containing protein [Haloarculaceae archaeon H-GB11]MEA5408570.1 NUDIX domain-containing protein [Haloarculaceae archaeon H-GB2-1]
METTRHFVATVYLVNDGAVALHEHDKLDMWLPAGGHIDRDELPHEAALREAEEETGLDVDLLAPEGDLSSATARSIPQPQHFLLEDINVSAEGVGHQHIDFIFYGEAASRDIDPGDGEQDADDWEWFTAADLRAHSERFADDVVEVGQQAIDAVESA